MGDYKVIALYSYRVSYMVVTMVFIIRECSGSLHYVSVYDTEHEDLVNMSLTIKGTYL